VAKHFLRFTASLCAILSFAVPCSADLVGNVRYDGVFESEWVLTIPIPGTFITRAGVKSVDTTNRTGTITLNAAEDTITYSGIGWHMPGHSFTFFRDALQVEVTVNAINITLDQDVTLPVTYNLGPDMATAGFEPSAFTLDNTYSGMFTVTGPNSQFTSTFSIPLNGTTPLNGRRFSVTRSGSQIIAFEGAAGVFFGPPTTNGDTVGSGEVDGIPFLLEARGSSFMSVAAVPEANPMLCLGLIAAGTAAVRYRRAWGWSRIACDSSGSSSLPPPESRRG
jgi:hypothetical protein